MGRALLVLLTLVVPLASVPAEDVVFPSESGLVDDFESTLAWRVHSDGGHPPAFEISTARAHVGHASLRLDYDNGKPEWGSISRRVVITGKEAALTFWLYVESAQPKAAMHIWLFEKDGDGWVQRVHAEGKDTLAAFVGRWVRVRLPLSEFQFSPRGPGTQRLYNVRRLVINCNFADFTAYVDDLAFELSPELRAQLRAEAQRRRRLVEEVMKRINWQPSQKGNLAIFRDEVPPAKEGVFSDPDYLGEILSAAGYRVSFLTGRDLASPGVLSPKLFDLLILPYGPRFPNEAADLFRQYLREGGRFLSMGGYAFDEPYFLEKEVRQKQLLANGGFEETGEGELPAGWFHGHSGQRSNGLVIRRVTDVKRSGKASLYVHAPDSVPMTWYIVRCRIDRPDKSHRYLLTASVRTRGIHDGPGAYIGVDFYRADGSRISFAQTGIVKDAADWHNLSLTFSVPPDTDHMTINGILYAHGEAWFDDFSLIPVPSSINTRHAVARDMLHTSEDQIPVFDPSFRLQRVAEVRSAPEQSVVSKDYRLDGKLEGYAAVALWGQNSAVKPEPFARWVPLVQAYDEYGHLQGTVGALLFHHAGPWKGSAWAFFGATDRDLFARGDKQGAALLKNTVDQLLQGVFLSVPEPSLMCYRPGEKVSGSVLAVNSGRAEQKLVVTAELRDPAKDRRTSEQLSQSVTLKPGEQQVVRFDWPVLDLPGDLYEMRFAARLGSDIVDQVSTGFCLWRPEVIARGSQVRWENNYFRVGDGAPRFLAGTNQTGVVLGPWWENPLAWAREFQYMHDWGLRVLRVLHISSFAEDLQRPGEKFLRRMDALVYMCQRHGLILFPCMHDWLGGIAIGDDVLREEAQFARLLAERYRDVPGIIIDIENEAGVSANNTPELRAKFNDFLKRYYGGDEAALRADWGEKAKFGEVPYSWPPGPEKWLDRRWLVFNLFRRELTARWLKANVEAMREVDRRHAITDEYYLLPAGDAGEANKYCDFVNVHCYHSSEPYRLKFYDHTAEGMGFAVGEFSRRSHPSFVHGWGWAPEPEVRRFYLHLLHADLGSGGSLGCNWDWKDMESCIFPWGLVYSCDLTPKSQFFVFRAVADFFAGLRLSYRAPEVYVVLPDLHLLGTREVETWRPARTCIDLLLRCGVPFGVLHDTNLDKLPSAARVIFYPCPFTLSDETFARLTQFVRAGGTLYLSGDFSYDARRQRTRGARLEELAGV
ncbi:MAG: beta-galactosidase, partial [Armatimonadetes bacterium]|nr:beta-galactosidase [Armatimonadota bacterium]